jgi:hypothetical protein
MTEEVILRDAAISEGGAGVFHQTVSGIDAEERSRPGEQLDTAADVEREHSVSFRQHA